VDHADNDSFLAGEVAASLHVKAHEGGYDELDDTKKVSV
jgi:hypothetical protein